MSRLVPDDSQPEHRVACAQQGDGAPFCLDYHAFMTYREGLGPEQAGALHVLWIPARMGVARKAQMQAAITRAGAAGTYILSLALLQCNVLAWEGPDFAGEPCTPAAIGRLNPEEDALAQFTLEQISARNRTRPSPDPKRRGAPGSPSAGAPPTSAPATPAATPSASMISPSSSP